MSATTRDRLLAAALTVSGQVEVWTYHRGVGGARLVNAVMMLAITLPLLWRRAGPVVVGVVINLAAFGADVLTGLSGALVTPTPCLFIAVFTVGAFADRRGVAAMVAVSLACALAGLPSPHIDSADAVFLFALEAVLLGAGMAVRSRTRMAARLADRAAILEHERDQQAELAAVGERERIARELHDVVAHCVNVMVLQAGAERRLVGGRTAAALTEIEETGRQALGELRRALGVVRVGADAAPLAPQPRLEDLSALVARSEAAGLHTTLDVGGDRRTLPPGLELSAYRIVQESLTNALKHAPGAAATVTLRYRTDGLHVEVANGPGGPASVTTGAGAGIVGMRERAALFGGSLQAGARDDGGFCVRARLPA